MRLGAEQHDIGIAGGEAGAEAPERPVGAGQPEGIGVHHQHGVGVEERQGVPEAAAGIEQAGLLGEAESPIGVPAGQPLEMGADLVRMVVNIDDEMRQTLGSGRRRDTVEERKAADLEQRLRPRLGEGQHAPAEAGSEQHDIGQNGIESRRGRHE